MPPCPYFRRARQSVTSDFPMAPITAKDGPIPVRRIKPERMSPFVKALMGMLSRARDTSSGQTRMANGATASMSARLRSATRASVSRPRWGTRHRRCGAKNLSILTGHHAERLVFEGKRATGAIVRPLDRMGLQRRISRRRSHRLVGRHSLAALLMRSAVSASWRAILEALASRSCIRAPASAATSWNIPSTAVSTYLPPHAARRSRRAPRPRDPAVLVRARGCARGRHARRDDRALGLARGRASASARSSSGSTRPTRAAR